MANEIDRYFSLDKLPYFLHDQVTFMKSMGLREPQYNYVKLSGKYYSKVILVPIIQKLSNHQKKKSCTIKIYLN